MKTLKKQLLLFLFLFCASFLTAQGFRYPAAQLMKLEQASTNKQGQAYVFVSPSKTGNHHNIYLINQQDTLIDYSCSNGFVRFKREAINDLGEWEAIDVPPWVCGTGMGYSSLPPEHYAFSHFGNDLLQDGSFKTEIRFLCQTKDNLLLSNAIPASINYHRFESVSAELEAARMDSLLEAGALSPKWERHLYSAKLRETLQDKAYKEAIKQAEFLLQKYSGLSGTYYYYAKALAGLAVTDKTLEEKEKIKLIQSAIVEWRKVPQENSLYPAAIRAIEIYKAYLANPKG